MKRVALSVVLSMSLVLGATVGGCGVPPHAYAVGAGLLAAALLHLPFFCTDDGDANQPTDANGVPAPIPGIQGPPGPAGADGEQGPAGPTYFSVFVEDFWGAFREVYEVASSGGHGPRPGLPVDLVKIEEPRLGKKCRQGCGADLVAGAIAYRMAVPQVYWLSEDANAPITMRIYLYKCGEDRCKPSPKKESAKTNINTYTCYGECDPNDPLVFSVIGKILRPTATVEDYGPAEGIWVQADAVGEKELLVIDIPLFLACPDGLGGDPVDPGDFLAFELNTVCCDAFYLILGVEFFAWPTAEVAGATILCEEPPCAELPDL